MSRKIKVAHEAPLSIIDKVAEKTDYSYALVHLFEESDKYREFFERELQKGRTVILDNSIFELGKAFDPKKYSYWINELRPTEYIIPDSLEDCIETKAMASNWMQDYSHLPGIKIGVVQGRTYAEIIDCYKYLDEKINVDKIAISFDYSYYLKTSNVAYLKISKQAKLAAWMLGRISLLEQLLANGVINKGKPHHLLGCSLPQEFKHYTGEKWSWIESVDTSNPIVAGLQLKAYDNEGALGSKPSVKLFTLINSNVTEMQWTLIENNIDKFKDNLTEFS